MVCLKTVKFKIFSGDSAFKPVLVADGKNIDTKILGERLKFIRKKERKTQEDIARFLNTTHSTWSAYENSKVLIPTIFIWKFAVEYKCSIDWLCGRIN